MPVKRQIPVSTANDRPFPINNSPLPLSPFHGSKKQFLQSLRKNGPALVRLVPQSEFCGSLTTRSVAWVGQPRFIRREFLNHVLIFHEAGLSRVLKTGPYRRNPAKRILWTDDAGSRELRLELLRGFHFPNP
jgi:hypothetical protein